LAASRPLSSKSVSPGWRSDSHAWTNGGHSDEPREALAKDESGATAIEYDLIAAGISVAIIAVVQGLGTNLKTTLGSVQSALK
jgi:pilus assembly protein Flp/PilA